MQLKAKKEKLKILLNKKVNNNTEKVTSVNKSNKSNKQNSYNKTKKNSSCNKIYQSKNAEIKLSINKETPLTNKRKRNEINGFGKRISNNILNNNKQNNKKLNESNNIKNSTSSIKAKTTDVKTKLGLDNKINKK